MLLTPDSYLVSSTTGKLLQVNGYTVTFNGLAHILHISAINGNTYKAGVIESLSDLSNHIKTKAEWLTSHPELFL